MVIEQQQHNIRYKKTSVGVAIISWKTSYKIEVRLNCNKSHFPHSLLCEGTCRNDHRIGKSLHLIHKIAAESVAYIRRFVSSFGLNSCRGLRDVHETLCFRHNCRGPSLPRRGVQETTVRHLADQTEAAKAICQLKQKRFSHGTEPSRQRVCSAER